MSAHQRRLYAMVLKLHPASFRNQFGRAMMLDFEDALAASGFASLCLDALLSLARQWAACFLPDAAEQASPRRLSLLAGDYVAISPGGPTVPNLLKASVLATMLLLTICFALKAPARRTPIDLPIGSGSQPRGISSPPQHRTSASGDRARAGVAEYTAAETGGESIGIGTRGRAIGTYEWAEKLKWVKAGSSSSIDPAAILYLWKAAASVEFLFLMTVLLFTRPSVGRKVILTTFGLLAFAAPAAFAFSRAPAFLSAAAEEPQPQPELLLFHASGSALSYEVATIKPLDPEAANTMVKLPPGAFLSPLSIRRYIMDAYGATYAAQVAGGPDWLNKDAYLIHGKVADDLEAAMQKMTYQERTEQNRRMQQSLLADRFHLKAHFETRVLPVFEFVPAKGGLKITEVPTPPQRTVDPPARPTSTSPLPPNSSRTTFSSNGLHVLNARAIKMELLARIIGNDAGDRPIVNHTGFTGSFDIAGLTWAPLGDAAADSAPDAPSLTVALEKTLGIKLAPTRAPIEVLVIDHIDKPSEN